MDSLRKGFAMIRLFAQAVRTTYAGAATLNIPIWQGGRTEGDITQAKAFLAQRQAEQQFLSLQ